jgi:hypothetical protein
VAAGCCGRASVRRAADRRQGLRCDWTRGTLAQTVVLVAHLGVPRRPPAVCYGAARSATAQRGVRRGGWVGDERDALRTPAAGPGRRLSSQTLAHGTDLVVTSQTVGGLRRDHTACNDCRESASQARPRPACKPDRPVRAFERRRVRRKQPGGHDPAPAGVRTGRFGTFEPRWAPCVAALPLPRLCFGQRLADRTLASMLR